MKPIYKSIPILVLGLGLKASAQTPPANYWGHAFDRGNPVEDSTLVNIYDTNGTGDGLSETGDDQLIGQSYTFTYDNDRGLFNINALSDDPATQQDEGAAKGAKTYFKLVRKGDGKEVLAYLDSAMSVHSIEHEPATSKNINAYSDFTIGIRPLDSKLDMNVYPNPSDGELFIEGDFGMGSRKLELYNTAGQEVLEGRYNDPMERMSLDLSGLANGVYILRVRTSDNKTATRKIIKR